MWKVASLTIGPTNQGMLESLLRVHCDARTMFSSVAKVEWETTVHDGPVTMMVRSPFMPHVLLTVGGYREEGSVSNG